MKTFFKGNYQDNFSSLELLETKGATDTIVVFLHGLYGTTSEKGTKSKILGSMVLESGIANIAYFNSSRDWKLYKDNEPQAAFANKTFDQERQDIIDALEIITLHASELFGTKQNKVWIVANSMGGTIASTLIEYFPIIKKMVLCGSGTGSSSPNKPILSTYPSKQYIKDSASLFHGDILLLQGSNDNVVPLWSQDELLEAYTNANARKIVLEGANHNFSELFNKATPDAYRLYANTIFNFLHP